MGKGLEVNHAIRTVLWTIVALTVYILVILVIETNGTGFDMKTLFDWLDILIFPVAVAIGAYWLNLRQSERAKDEEARYQKEQQSLEDQREQDAALRTYMERMGHLILDRRLSEAKGGGMAT